MLSTDPIADMLTRIRNGIAVNKSIVSMPYSKQKHGVAKVLESHSFIDSIETNGKKGFKTLTLTLNQPNSNSKITEIERLSKPGRRLYTQSKEIPKVKSGRGIVVISTSKGIMSGLEAKNANLGGELICKVY